MNDDAIKNALLSFVQTIEDMGGVTANTGNDDGGPAGDPFWLDLEDSYRNACAVLGRPVMEANND